MAASAPTSMISLPFFRRGAIHWIFASLLFLALKCGAIVAFFGDFGQDPDAYRRLAESWATHGVYGFQSIDGTLVPTAFRPPLYPFLLHCMVVDGKLPSISVAGLHLVLGVATSLLVVRCVQRLSPHSTILPWVVGLTVTLDPILLRQSALIMTEITATFLAVLAWWWWIEFGSFHEDQWVCKKWPWFNPLGLGVVLGLGAICRPTGLVWAALWMLAILFLGVRDSRTWCRLRFCGWMGLGLMICIAPWAARNQWQLGKPVAMTTHGGYTLLLANNTHYYEHLREKGPSRDWDAAPFHKEWEVQGAHGEIEFDRIANKEARSVIETDPGTFVYSCFVRVGWLWAWWPAESNGALEGSSNWKSIVLRCLIGVWYGIWICGAVWGVASTFLKRGAGLSGLRLWLPVLLLVFSLTAVHAVYFSNMRMRSPAMPALYAWVFLFWAGKGKSREMVNRYP